MPKTTSINLSSFEMQFSHSLLTILKAGNWKDDNQLGCESNQYTVWQKDQYSSRYNFLKYSILRSQCMLDELEIPLYAINSRTPYPCQWGGVSALVDIGAYQVARGAPLYWLQYFCINPPSTLLLGYEEIWLPYSLASRSMSGKILGMIGQDPSVSKSNRLHVVIFRLFFQ
jgi:hypothetical protein